MCSGSVSMVSAPLSHLGLRSTSDQLPIGNTHVHQCSSLVVMCDHSAIMPHLPLRCQLLNELDDVNCSFKCAHLSKYLQDTIEPFHPSSDVDSNSNMSLISTISSVSSVSSLDSDDKAPSQHSLSYSFSDIEEMYFVTTQAKIDKLC